MNMKKRMDSKTSSTASFCEILRQCGCAIVICMILGFIARAGFAIYRANLPLVGDGILYDQVAVSIVNGHGVVFKNLPLSDKAPGYSVFLAAIYTVFGHSFIYVYLIQGILSAIVCGATAALGYAVTRKREVALLAGLFMALYPPLALADSEMFNDSPFGFLVFFLIVLVGWAVSSRKIWPWAIGGLVLGLAMYIRPTAVAFPLIFLVLTLWRRWPFTKAILAVAILLTCTGLVLTPWAVRNQRLFGVFTPMPSQGGRVLYCNWSAINMVSSDLGSLPADVKEKVGDKTGYERDKIFKKIAIKQIKSNPSEFVVSCFMKIARQWTNLFWSQSPSKSTLLFAAVNILLLALAVPGFWNRNIDLLFRGYTLLFVLYVTFIAAVMSSAEPRYAYWTYPFLFVLAANTLTDIWLRRKHATEAAQSS